MQLVLGARRRRVHGHPDDIVGQSATAGCLQVRARLPGVGEVILGVVGDQGRAFDSFDGHGRKQERVQPAELQHREPAAAVDLGARQRTARQPLVGNADLADRPQRLPPEKERRARRQDNQHDHRDAGAAPGDAASAPHRIVDFSHACLLHASTAPVRRGRRRAFVGRA